MDIDKFAPLLMAKAVVNPAITQTVQLRRYYKVFDSSDKSLILTFYYHLCSHMYLLITIREDLDAITLNIISYF